MNLQDISAHWMALHEALGIGEPITSEAGYERGLAFVEQVFDGGLAEGPLSGLLSVLADRIRAYEERVHPWDDRSTPASALAALMQQHGLKQGELPEGGWPERGLGGAVRQAPAECASGCRPRASIQRTR